MSEKLGCGMLALRTFGGIPHPNFSGNFNELFLYENGSMTGAKKVPLLHGTKA